ncbi:MAG: hypothetical protein H6Q28_546 [Bacteroidetes bacterium]|nr:hypothetical protein [Bacteroidota bacterium]
MSRNLSAFLSTLGFGPPRPIRADSLNVSEDEYLYAHEGLAFRIRKPAHWYFLGHAEWERLWSEILYEDFSEIDGEYLKALLGKPLFVISRHLPSVEGVIPGVSLWPEPADDEMDLLEFHERRLTLFAEMVRHIIVHEPPSPCRIGG